MIPPIVPDAVYVQPDGRLNFLFLALLFEIVKAIESGVEAP